MRFPLLALFALLLLAGFRGVAPSIEAFADEVAPPWVAQLKGKYSLWQDGEANLGRLCKVFLSDRRTIGGYAIHTDNSCQEQIQLAGEPAAWFLRDDGYLILIDATRQVLLTMRRLEDGDWKDSRRGDYVDAVLLSPLKP